MALVDDFFYLEINIRNCPTDLTRTFSSLWYSWIGGAHKAFIWPGGYSLVLPKLVLLFPSKEVPKGGDGQVIIILLGPFVQGLSGFHLVTPLPHCVYEDAGQDCAEFWSKAPLVCWWHYRALSFFLIRPSPFPVFLGLNVSKTIETESRQDRGDDDEQTASLGWEWGGSGTLTINEAQPPFSPAGRSDPRSSTAPEDLSEYSR